MRTHAIQPEYTKRNLFDFFYNINKKGGPDVSEYSYLNTCIGSIPLLLSQKLITVEDIENIKEQCEFLHTRNSVMGHIKTKPFGYAGDYLIIERIYQKQLSEQYFKWDQYSMINPAAEAVRNRKQYFKDLIKSKLQQHQTVRLLDIASGPARDLKELYDEIDPLQLTTTCVEMDERAIDFAKKICSDHIERIDFINKNIFKFQTDQKFDVIWSAGLFDYFNDKSFVQLVSQLKNNLEETGEICIGNFSKDNPGRVYMEVFGEWFLNHRDANELTELAVAAGIERHRIRVEQETLGINLFLRISNKE